MAVRIEIIVDKEKVSLQKQKDAQTDVTSALISEYVSAKAMSAANTLYKNLKLCKDTSDLAVLLGDVHSEIVKIQEEIA